MRRLGQTPVDPQDGQQLRREHDVAVLAALAVLDPDQHAAAVEITDLECGDLRHPQPSTIGRGQRRSAAQPGDRLQEARDLLGAQHDRQLFRLLGTDDVSDRILPAERHAEEEAQGARHLVDVRPRQPEADQVDLVGANLSHTQLIRRPAKEATELRHGVDVGLLCRWREITNRHVVDQPPTQRGHPSHLTLSCLTMGLGHPPSSQTEDIAVTACSPCRGSGFVQYQ